MSKFDLTDFFAENLLTDIVLPTRCIQNMFIMMLTAAGVKRCRLIHETDFWDLEERKHNGKIRCK